MIQEIIDAIKTALEATPGVVGDIEQYAGDIAELVKKPRRLPVLWVIYNGADFEGRKVVDNVLARHTMQFTVVLIAKNHRSRADGAEACHTVIEAVRTRLIGLVIAEFGAELWPVRESLIDATGPLLVYGLTYRLKADYSAS